MDFPVPGEFDLALFFERLLGLLNDPANRNLMVWSPDGKRFLIRDDQRFQVELCPLFFQLCSWSNFLQTLYGCGFRRTRTKLEFHHPVFNRRRLETMTKTQRQTLFLSELGVKPSTPNTKNEMQTWEDWLGPEIQCHPENPASPRPGPSNRSPNEENQPKPRCRKNSNPVKFDKDNPIFGVDKVTSESSSDELPVSTTTSNRDTTSEASTPKTPNSAVNEEDTVGDANSFNPGASNDHTYSIAPERELETSEGSTKNPIPDALNEENTAVDVQAISTEQSNQSRSSATDEPGATQNPHQALNDESSSSGDQVSSSNASTTSSWNPESGDGSSTSPTDRESSSDNPSSIGDQASNDGSPNNDQESSPGSSNGGDEDQASGPEESLSSSDEMSANIRGLANGNADVNPVPNRERLIVRIRKDSRGRYRKG